VPNIRALVRQHQRCTLVALRPLIRSKFHEERLFAVLMLADWCKWADDHVDKNYCDFYLAEKIVYSWNNVR
jgi:hypothetical protein